MVSRRSLHRATGVLLLVAGQSLITASPARSAIVVNVTVADYGQIGGLGAKTPVVVTGINSSGDISGYYGSGATTTAFVFDKGSGGGRTDITAVGSSSSKAFGISERSGGIGTARVVGQVSPGNASTGFILGNRPGSVATVSGISGTSEARAVNNAGLVVGVNSALEAFSAQTPYMLTTPLAAAPSAANAVNNNGVIVGVAAGKAYVFDAAGSPLSAGALSGLDLATSSVANGVSNSSNPTVVGSASIGGVTKAFTHQGGSTSFLTFGDVALLSSEALAVNKDGWVVGTAETEVGGVFGFLAIAGQMFDINAYMPSKFKHFTITSLSAISDSGLIGGVGRSKNGNYEVFSMQVTAVPEPGSVLLLSMVGVGGWFKYRRRQSKLAVA
jgi:hypothetical protein